MSTFGDLTAIFLNCSLEADPGRSHTRRLMERVAGVMAAEGVGVTTVHVREHVIPFGMVTDATEHGAERDDWPDIQRRIFDADIVVLGTPIWLGAKSSVATLVVERMYAASAELNARGQYRSYGAVAGCVVTGNEDGVKACSMEILYAMQHIGYAIPPQADCGWIGEIGPGPSYGDVDPDGHRRVGYDSEFTNRNATVMAWNLMHMAAMLRANGGIPARGNTPGSWREVTNATMIEPTEPQGA